MGCGTSNHDSIAPVRINTVTGKLKITITNAVIFHKVSSFKMDPYIILKLSNQIFTSKVIENGDKQPSFFETFTFFINSCYKIHGRNLQVTLMDRKKIGMDGEIGFGIADLDQVVNFKKPKDQFRCFVNYDREKAGLVNIIAEFVEQAAKTLSFRFDTASIRRKTSTFGSMNCWVQATIGEEVLKTHKSKDTKQAAPNWTKDVLTFNVPASAKQAQIVVMDDNDEVGSFTLQLDKLLASNSEQSYNEQFLFKNQVNAGSLKFQTLTGTNPIFSQPKVIMSKIVEPPKNQQPKKEQPKKQQPKKEEPKKQQPKKEQPKKEEPKKQQPPASQPKP